MSLLRHCGQGPDAGQRFGCGFAVFDAPRGTTKAPLLGLPCREDEATLEIWKHFFPENAPGCLDTLGKLKNRRYLINVFSEISHIGVTSASLGLVSMLQKGEIWLFGKNFCLSLMNVHLLFL